MGLLTPKEKFECCVVFGISKEAHFSFTFVNCPERCNAFSCIDIVDSCEKFLY